MAKFKVGDKVTRKVCTESRAFYELLEHREYYTVTDVQNLEGAGLQWLQVDGYGITLYNPCPWLGDNFELYVEPEEELPPAPTDVLYVSAQDYYRALRARPFNRFGTGKLLIDLHIGGGIPGDGKSCALSADDVLQLAHDLRRMAMDIKRKEKA